MSIKIAVPDNPVYSELVLNSEAAGIEEIKIYRVPEQQCSELLYTNRVDAAFITPLAYGQSVGSGDYRIVPGPVIAYGGYSGKASIYFRPGAVQIKTCASPAPEDFIMILGRLLLMERYDIEVEIEKLKGSRDEILKKADSAMLWEHSRPGADSLDISELWGDSFEIPLILGFWACPAEDYHPAVAETVNRIWDHNLMPEEYVAEDVGDSVIPPREGIILRRWNDEMEPALEKTLDLLFYHQLINELEAVKILGRD